VMQTAAVCCSVWQCVAVCCSVLQCVAVCCIVLQCVAVYCKKTPDNKSRVHTHTHTLCCKIAVQQIKEHVGVHS